MMWAGTTMIQPFDEVAESYDGVFTDSPLGRDLRRIVWSYLAKVFQPGARLLEMNCGTGEDAVWLAERGLRVLATDSSEKMLARAKEKAAAHRMSGEIEFRHFDLADPVASWPDLEFDGAISNFGGFNCVRDLGPLSGVLSRGIRQGGHLIVVVMGRVSLWEMVWHILRLKPRTAFRRFPREGARARIGDAELCIWYPSVRNLRAKLGPDFRLRQVLGVGVFLPPTYMQEFIGRRPRLYRILRRLEYGMGATPLFRSIGDHILLDFERTPCVSRIGP